MYPKRRGEGKEPAVWTRTELFVWLRSYSDSWPTHLAHLLQIYKHTVNMSALSPPQPPPNPAAMTFNGDSASLIVFIKLLRPLLPPVLQQDERVWEDYVAVHITTQDSTDIPIAPYVVIHGLEYDLAALADFTVLQEALEGGAAVALWGDATTRESGSGHAVVSAGVARVEELLSSNRPLVRVAAVYKGDIETLTCNVYLLPTLTGLQMKSAVISALGLEGGFQDFYLRADDLPFGSRTAIEEHTSYKEGMKLILTDVGDGPKAVGHT